VLSDSEQLNPVAQAVVACIDFVYQVGHFSSFDMNNMTDQFSSALRARKNRME